MLLGKKRSSRPVLVVKSQRELQFAGSSGADESGGIDHAGDSAEARGVEGTTRLTILGTVEQIERFCPKDQFVALRDGEPFFCSSVILPEIRTNRYVSARIS